MPWVGRLRGRLRQISSRLRMGHRSRCATHPLAENARGVGARAADRMKHARGAQDEAAGQMVPARLLGIAKQLESLDKTDDAPTIAMLGELSLPNMTGRIRDIEQVRATRMGARVSALESRLARARARLIGPTRACCHSARCTWAERRAARSFASDRCSPT